MATAQKKKTTAKRATKTAAKTAYSAATRSARTATNAASTAANHTNAWAKEGAKLYQLPFATGDIEAAGKQAAAKLQSQAESMMKMGSDAMQQFWTQAQGATKNPQAALNKMKAQANDVFGNALPKMPGMDSFKLPGMDQFKMPGMENFKPEETFKKFENFARETAETFSKSTNGSGKALNDTMELSRENAEAVVEVSNIAIALVKELGAEAISFANKSYSQNVEISKEVLTCRTLNDMFDLAGRLAKANLDSFFSQSVKFSEMLFQCANEVSEPLNERVSESAERLSKAMAA